MDPPTEFGLTIGIEPLRVVFDTRWYVSLLQNFGQCVPQDCEALTSFLLQLQLSRVGQQDLELICNAVWKSEFRDNLVVRRGDFQAPQNSVEKCRHRA